MRSNWMRLQSSYRWVGILGVIIACLLVGCGLEGHAVQPPQAGSMIYVLSTGEMNASNPSPDARTRIAALQVSDGSQRWDTSLTGRIVFFKQVDGIVYVVVTPGGSAGTSTLTFTLMALRANDGSLLWQFQGNRPFSNPLIDKGVLYLLTAGQSGSPQTYSMRCEPATVPFCGATM